jgi:hypothetical protein
MNDTKPGTYKFETLDASGLHVCCGANDLANFSRCENCKDQPLRTASLRTAVPADNFEPPDPYRSGLEKMRAGLPVPPVMRESPCPFEDKNYHPGDGSAPDPYKIAIERMKK